MNGRVGSDSSQYVLVSDVKKPNITVGAWKDTISKSVKILEGMLYCEAVDVYLLLSH